MKKIIKTVTALCFCLSLNMCVSDPNLCDKPQYNYPGSVCDMAHG